MFIQNFDEPLTCLKEFLKYLLNLSHFNSLREDYVTVFIIMLQVTI